MMMMMKRIEDKGGVGRKGEDGGGGARNVNKKRR